MSLTPAVSHITHTYTHTHINTNKQTWRNTQPFTHESMAWVIKHNLGKAKQGTRGSRDRRMLCIASSIFKCPILVVPTCLHAESQNWPVICGRYLP